MPSTALVDKVRRRYKRQRVSVSVGASAQVTVGSVPAFRVAHAIATVCAHPSRRWTITLRPGIYRMQVECSSGVDLAGQPGATIVWDGPGDTVDLNGADVEIRDLTVRHEGDSFDYAIHSDAPGPGPMRLIRVEAYSDSKSALGIGLFDGQRLKATECHFERGTLGRLSQPVFAHNWFDGGGQTLTFQGCTATSQTGGPLSVWIDKNTGAETPIEGIQPAVAAMA